eukprot:TRINITY_DN9308_c0_g2_i2.p1 TRINITY_DN9308_c0_g2~~TRINITY_DN9308_c0_g2_i2.p1  ORF type:complete len:478 (+),score=39.93 TRINITY_DN9308_c0_g2_i2:190-1434(+)
MFHVLVSFVLAASACLYLVVFLLQLVRDIFGHVFHKAISRAHASPHVGDRQDRCLYISLLSGQDRCLYISFLSGRVLQVHANPLWTVSDLKETISSLEGIPMAQIRLFFCCSEVQDSTRLEHCETTEFNLILRSQECAAWLEQFRRNSACKLCDASEDVLSSKECVLAAARQSGVETLKFSAAFRDDKEVVLAAVQNDGLSLFFASPRLRGDAEVALLAISRDPESMLAVHEPLSSDPGFFRRAFWVSSLEFTEKPRLDEFGLLGGRWEAMLHENHKHIPHKFWSALHSQLRRPSKSLSLGITFNTMIVFSSNFLDEVLEARAIKMIASLTIYFVLRLAMRRLHVDFVTWAAGPISNCKSETILGSITNCPGLPRRVPECIVTRYCVLLEQRIEALKARKLWLATATQKMPVQS